VIFGAFNSPEMAPDQKRRNRCTIVVPIEVEDEAAMSNQCRNDDIEVALSRTINPLRADPSVTRD
jgi:hypothetical protein